MDGLPGLTSLTSLVKERRALSHAFSEFIRYYANLSLKSIRVASKI
jgi:hypothetical protein